VSTYGLHGIEPVFQALKTKLEADLPAVITAVNAEFASVSGWSTLSVPVVKDHSPPTPMVKEFPLVGMVALNDSTDDDVGYEVTTDYTVGLVVFEQDAEHDVMSKKLRGQVLAVKRAVMAGASTTRRRLSITPTGMSDGRMGLLGTRYGPAAAQVVNEEAPPYAYWSWAMVQVRVTCDEE
jgi:hypothetical protein